MGRRCHAAIALAVLGLILTTFTVSRAQTLNAKQSEALATYDRALGDFKSILAERRRQIEAKEPLPNLPGQALYLARVAVISAYKDLTDAMPSRIGKPNKFEIPPAYFDADIEPLIDEYSKLFDVMEAPPAGAQNSATPFKDVVDLATAIARAKGLAPAHAEAAGRISLGLFFAETNGKQNVRNGRSNTYMGSFQTGPSEDRNGRRKWEAIKGDIAAADPELSARDDKEEARARGTDYRFNHWTNVRDGLMNAHAEVVPGDSGNREDTARPDRPDEAVRADPDRADPDAVRAQVRRCPELQGVQPDHHEAPAQQQHLRVWTGRPGAQLGQLPGDPRCDVAVQPQVRARDGEIFGDQGALRTYRRATPRETKHNYR